MSKIASLKSKKHLLSVGIAASILILYIIPLGQVSFAPPGNGNGNSYGPNGNGPPEFVPRGPNPNPGEPRGKPDGVPPDGSGIPPGQEKKQQNQLTQGSEEKQNGNDGNKIPPGQEKKQQNQLTQGSEEKQNGNDGNKGDNDVNKNSNDNNKEDEPEEDEPEEDEPEEDEPEEEE